MSELPPFLPLELWWMVIDHLRSEESPQHISRLAQTCKWFHREVNHFVYQPVKLVKRDNALRFADLMRERPDLKVLVTEIRHYADSGFQNFTFHSNAFYKQLSTLQSLQTLAMRPKPDYEKKTRLNRWEDLLQRTCTFIRVRDWEEEVMEDMEKIVNEERDPRKQPPNDPFEFLERPNEDDIPADEHDLMERARFCGGYLEDAKLPALRTCHIGDYGVPCQACEPPIFNESILYLSQLKTLCVTGATFSVIDYDDGNPHAVPSMPCLEELKLLNCDINTAGLLNILKRTVTLKRLTLRGHNEFGEFKDNRLDSELYGSLSFGQALADFTGQSLESLDLDIYDGTAFGMSLKGLSCLEILTVTPYTIVRLDDELLPEYEAILPPSLERLVLRHEEGEDLTLSHLFKSVESGGLPSLVTITVQIPDMEQAQDCLTSPEVLIEAKSWVTKFKELDVALEVIRSPMVPREFLREPKIDLCSCEVLEMFHRRRYSNRSPSPLLLFPRPSDNDQDTEDSSGRDTGSEDSQNLN